MSSRRPTPSTMLRHSMAVFALVVAAALSGCGGVVIDADDGSSASGVVHRFVIPPGTGDLLDRGETVDVMPSRLEIGVGDAIEIVNNDDRDHNAGLFFVRRGETVSQVFPSVAEFSDVCSVSTSGQFTIIVT